MQQFGEWLSVPWARGESIHASGCRHAWAGEVQLQLPCHRLEWLQQLDLSNLNTSLLQHVDAAAGAPAGLLPRLRNLRLAAVGVPSQLLVQMAQCTGLTRLHIDDLRVYKNSWTEPLTAAEQAAATAQLLRHLTGLSTLCCDVCTAAAEVLVPISSMQRLETIWLTVKDDFDAASLAALPASLTSLALDDNEELSEALITSAARLSRLTNLRQLSADIVHVQPDGISSLTWLQRLHLINTLRWPRDPAHTPGLLRALACLTQLQHLELDECPLPLLPPPPPQQQQQQQQQQPDAQQQQQPVAQQQQQPVAQQQQPVGQQQQPVEQQQQQLQHDSYQLFAGLTASSQLTALVLAGHAAPLPSPQALEYMFPAGKLLPHLAVLQLVHHQDTPREYCVCVEAGSIQAIARRCPGLIDVRLVQVTAGDFDTGCLEQLPPGVTRVAALGWLRE
jgi:hypothetical protein